jgi:hypothetical protein
MARVRSRSRVADLSDDGITRLAGGALAHFDAPRVRPDVPGSCYGMVLHEDGGMLKPWGCQEQTSGRVQITIAVGLGMAIALLCASCADAMNTSPPATNSAQNAHVESLPMGDRSGVMSGGTPPISVSMTISDIVAEIKVTAVSPARFDTSSGAQLTREELAALWQYEPDLAVLADGIYRLGDLASVNVFSGTTSIDGFVVLLPGGTVGDVTWVPPTGGFIDADTLEAYPNGVVFLESADKLVDALNADGFAVSPSIAALVARADALSQGGLIVEPMFVDRWFQFIDANAVEHRTGLSKPIAALIDEMEAASGQ